MLASAAALCLLLTACAADPRTPGCKLHYPVAGEPAVCRPGEVVVLQLDGWMCCPLTDSEARR